MLVCLYSHNCSSCDNPLAIIRFHVSYGSGTPCFSEMCNLSAVILPVITFQRYPILTTSVQTRCSALILRLVKFQRYPTQGYEIVSFHFWLDDDDDDEAYSYVNANARNQIQGFHVQCCLYFKQEWQSSQCKAEQGQELFCAWTCGSVKVGVIS